MTAAAGDGDGTGDPSLRTRVRRRVIARQLEGHLADPPTSAIDIGSGDGWMGLWLARRGFEVTLLDASEQMLRAAAGRLAGEPPEVRGRVERIHGRAERGPELLDGARFGLVCCHALLPHIEDATALAGVLRDLMAPGAILSLVFKNAEALAMRAGLRGRFGDVAALLDADAEVATDGTILRAHRLEEITADLQAAGLTVRDWHGVQVFTVHRRDRADAETVGLAADAEVAAGDRDPYRRVARLLHVIAGTRR